jgi:hypothetical protein
MLTSDVVHKQRKHTRGTFIVGSECLNTTMQSIKIVFGTWNWRRYYMGNTLR